MAGWGDGGTGPGSRAVEVDDEGRESRWEDGKRKSSAVLGRQYRGGYFKWIGVSMEQGEEDIINSNAERLLKRPWRWQQPKKDAVRHFEENTADGHQVGMGNIEEERGHRRRLGVWLWILPQLCLIG